MAIDVLNLSQAQAGVEALKPHTPKRFQESSTNQRVKRAIHVP